MLADKRYAVWSQENLNLRGMNFSESRILKETSARKARSKYTPGKIRLGVAKNITSNAQAKEYIVLPPEEDAEGIYYEVIGPGVEYTQGGNTFYSCKELSLNCQSDLPATNHKCDKNKCVWGTLRPTEDEIYYFQSSQDSTLNYYTNNKLRPSAYSYGIDISKPILAGQHIEDVKNYVLLHVYEHKCGKNAACINSLFSTKDLSPAYKTINLFLDGLQDAAWKEYLLVGIDELLAQDITSYEFVLLALRFIFAHRGFLLLHSNRKYKKSKVSYDIDYPRPVYYRLPAGYTRGDSYSQDDILYINNLEQRFSIPLKDLDFGALVIDSTGKKGYRYEPRRLLSPVTRLNYGLNPIDTTIEFSPKDPHSWKLLDIAEIPGAVNPTKWLMGGIDFFLSQTHMKMERFFTDFVDPNTCFAMALDWNYQFYGWTPRLWNTEWDTETKRSLLKNSLGWFNKEIFKSNLLVESHNNRAYTYKGTVMGEFPFNVYENFWKDETTDAYYWGDILPQVRTLDATTGIVTQEPQEALEINKQYWDGLFPSKGNLLCLLFLLSVFRIEDTDFSSNIEAYDPGAVPLVSPHGNDPLRIIPNSEQQNVNVDHLQKISLNITRSLHRPIKPIILSPVQTGNMEDYASLNNPLLAGISRINYESTRVILPIAYKDKNNFNLREKLDYIIKSWMPLTTEITIQHPYPAAEYARADDYFFEYVRPAIY